MTTEEMNKLTDLINVAFQAKPEIDPEKFMFDHWRPFLQTLDLPDRRMAWQVYLRAQVSDFQIITKYLSSLSGAQLKRLRPTLERLTGLESPSKSEKSLRA